MIRRVGIINYGAGNLKSISKAIKVLGLTPVIVEINDIEKFDLLILPGVGNFGSAMKIIRKNGLSEKIVKYVSSGKPLLGICLGLQLLFKKSEEDKNVSGLGLIKGEVVKFRVKKFPVPHMCWNIVQFEQKNSVLLNGLSKEEYFYFVHSYYPVVEEKNVVFGTTVYEKTKFCSMLLKNNIVATQFHIEKSGSKGLKLLNNIITYFKKI